MYISTCGMDGDPRDLALVVVKAEIFLISEYIHTYIRDTIVLLGIATTITEESDFQEEHLVLSGAEISLP